jgi:hypothetical protein
MSLDVQVTSDVKVPTELFLVHREEAMLSSGICPQQLAVHFQNGLPLLYYIILYYIIFTIYLFIYFPYASVSVLTAQILSWGNNFNKLKNKNLSVLLHRVPTRLGRFSLGDSVLRPVLTLRTDCSCSG